MEYGAKPRSQYDPNMVFPALSAPFISCYIGSDMENGVHIGNTYLQQQDGAYDPKFIKSIQVWRTVPDHSSSIFSALLAYIRAMNTSDTLTPEERDRYGKNAEKELEKKQKEAKEARLNAPKELEEKLKGMTDRYLHSVNRGGVRANIELSLIGDISLMTWLYNYSVSQKLRPNLRLQYGIMAGNGQRLRVSPVYEGIIMSAKIQNFWDLSLSVVFTPSKAIGWNPEAFNKIFKDPTGRKENAGKTTNMPSRPYKEGQQVISVNEKTRRYSNVVRRIAEGLEWNIGHIEPTTLMPEGVLITVDGFENGPLDYIQEHFCGIVDQKDGNGKTVKAGAISEREHLMGYTAYFDYDENKKCTSAFESKGIHDKCTYLYFKDGIPFEERTIESKALSSTAGKDDIDLSNLTPPPFYNVDINKIKNLEGEKKYYSNGQLEQIITPEGDIYKFEPEGFLSVIQTKDKEIQFHYQYKTGPDGSHNIIEKLANGGTKTTQYGKTPQEGFDVWYEKGNFSKHVAYNEQKNIVDYSEYIDNKSIKSRDYDSQGNLIRVWDEN